MSVALFLQLWQRTRMRVAALAIAAAIWGALAPVIFATLVSSLRSLTTLPKAITSFNGGNLFTLPGIITVFFQHPILVALGVTAAVATPLAALSGARARGTLEVALARPVTRLSYVTTVGIVTMTMVGVVIAAHLAGTAIGVTLEGQSGQVDYADFPLLWFAALLLFSDFAAFGLLCSVLFTRPAPAMGATLAYVIVHYFVEVIGGFWSTAQPYQPWSFFHHFVPADILSGTTNWTDLAILAGGAVVPAAIALVVFPRRDLPAPD